VLKKMSQEPRVLDLYAKAAKLVTKPDLLSGRPEYIHESNWYKVREGYAGKLDDAGQKSPSRHLIAWALICRQSYLRVHRVGNLPNVALPPMLKLPPNSM
jgi:hypothetical protein